MQPLASRIRPSSLKEFVGQKQLVGKDKPLSVAIAKKHLFSFILWGPPGVGKTTLARLYAQALDARFFELSAVSAGKEDIRKIVEDNTILDQRPKLLFLDEIHRFNKAQQDFLLPHVESGALTLVGATTENPSFEVIPALLSRCRVFVLERLSDEELVKIVKRADVPMDKKSLEYLAAISNGDARIALSVLDHAHSLYKKVDVESLQKTLEKTYIRFDKKGDEHYDTISAYIKSMRSGDADAALYYLARMIEGGEDPKFIARRMVVFASEDIGLAQPTALVVANEVFRAVETVGLPEAAINLAHGTSYLALSKKDRSSYDAYFEALADVQKLGNLPVPMNVRNAPTKLMKELGYHKGYEMYSKESYLPQKLKGKKYLKFKKKENPEQQ